MNYHNLAYNTAEIISYMPECTTTSVYKLYGFYIFTDTIMINCNLFFFFILGVK